MEDLPITKFNLFLIVVGTLLTGVAGGMFVTSFEKYSVFQSALDYSPCQTLKLKWYWYEQPGLKMPSQDWNWSKIALADANWTNSSAQVFCPIPARDLQPDVDGCERVDGILCGFKTRNEVMAEAKITPTPTPSTMPLPGISLTLNYANSTPSSNGQVFGLKNRIYYINNEKFVIDSVCPERVNKQCGGACCGGYAWWGEEKYRQIFILNGGNDSRYTRDWYYDVCAHERLHIRFESYNETAIETVRKREKDAGLVDWVCTELLERAKGE